MTIKNSVSNDFLSTFVDSIDVFDCRLSDVVSVVVILLINTFEQNIAMKALERLHQDLCQFSCHQIGVMLRLFLKCTGLRYRVL